MIDEVFKFLKYELNQYLRLKIDTQNMNKVFLKSIMKQDGTVEMENDALSMLLVNIEEETTMAAQAAYVRTEDNDIAVINPEINLNLFAFLVSNFTSYEESLKFLSLAITFFQGKSVFSRENSAHFEGLGVEKIIVKLKTINLEEQNHLWGMLGAKYLPSVMYKINSLPIQDNRLASQIPPIKVINHEFEKN